MKVVICHNWTHRIHHMGMIKPHGEMIEEPCQDIDEIGSFDKYIVVTVKLGDVINSGGSITIV